MKKVLLILALALTTSMTFAQDTPLEISGSGDLYYKYDLSKNANIGTSFATDQNSASLGMVAIALKKKTGKTSFVSEVSFGPRGAGQSIPDVGGQSFHIQNLYASYAATEKLTLTAGYMATFVGYEVISPLGNLNYSTSYLFTNGPFQNAGVKANYAFSSKVGLMVGAFNDQWNVYKANPAFGLNAFGAQLSLAPVEGLTAYINFLDGSASGTIIDLTAAYQITEKFKLGVNAADYSGTADDTGYNGFAVYPSYAFSKTFGLALRAENFTAKKNSVYSANGFSTGVTGDESVTALTLSANLKSGNLTFIPEFRMDSGSKEMFSDSDFITTGNTMATKSASQVSLAVVYGF
ncbi:porin [Flavobacterium myungsuense]|uniref:Porin n=1 Tax=Flavobacterium myungsuense TaxID=651823 RepID=A0ABW3IXQ8_9FLAO